MSTATATITAKMHRTQTLVRGEESTVKIRLVPKPAFFELPEDAQAEALAESKKLTQGSFGVTREGFVHMCSYWLAQYVDVEIDEGDWNYDGGEVSTLSERYDRLDDA